MFSPLLLAQKPPPDRVRQHQKRLQRSPGEANGAPTVTTAELSIQFADDAPSKLYSAKLTDERIDEEQWKLLEGKTPNTAGDAATPSVEWLFISRKGTVSLRPLCNAKGFRICRVPSFVRAKIYPARFGFPPRLDTEYEEEAEEMFLEASRAEVAAGRLSPDKDNLYLRHSILHRLWLKYRTQDEEKRWLDKLHGIGCKLMRGHHYQNGIHNRDLDRIHYRADFYAAGSLEPVSVFCATCEERLTSVADAKTLLAPTKRNTRRPTAKKRQKVFNNEFTHATIPAGRGKYKALALEPEQTKLVKRIVAEPEHRIARTKLVAERVASTRPEKYFKRGALKELWRAKVIGKTPTGRLTTYWVRLFLP